MVYRPDLDRVQGVFRDIYHRLERNYVTLRGSIPEPTFKLLKYATPTLVLSITAYMLLPETYHINRLAIPPMITSGGLEGIALISLLK